MKTIQDRFLKVGKLPLEKLKWLQAPDLKDAGDIEKLVTSLKQNGIIRTFRVWEDPEGVVWILDGHHMELAFNILAKDPEVEIPKEFHCTFIECEDKEDAAKLVLLNSSTYARISASGVDAHIKNFNLDFEGLAEELSFDTFDFGNIDKELKEEKGEEVKDKFKDIEKIEGKIEFKVPKIAITQPGDTYVFKSENNKHALWCGDSRHEDKIKALLSKLDNDPIIMVTDPPYGVNYDPNWRNEAPNLDKRKRIGKVQNDDIVSWGKSYALFPGHICYVWHAGNFAYEVGKDLKECGFKLPYQIMWAKNHFAIGRGDYHWQHEACYYGVKKGNTHNWQGSRSESTVWFIERLDTKKGKEEQDTTSVQHGTQKPLQCMSKPIENNTEVGDTVYDPFLGSGTTLIAAEGLQRNCVGADIDQGWCDVTVARFINLKQKQGKSFEVYRNGRKLSKAVIQKYLLVLQD